MRLRELRISRGISQKDLAKYFGMSSGNLCDWEKGRSEPDIAGLIRLANFFGESIDYLVGRVDEDMLVHSQPVSRAKQRLIYLIRMLSDKNVKVLISMAEYMRIGGNGKSTPPDMPVDEVKTPAADCKIAENIETAFIDGRKL